MTNLQTSRKSEVWRAAASSGATIKAAWSTAESISTVHLPFCNLSPTATMRVRLANEATATNVLTVNSDRFETFGGTAPTSVRYVLGPDGYYSGVVPNAAASTGRYEISIPIGAYPNGTVLVVSWHQKVVPYLVGGGATIVPQSWVGANLGTVNSVAAANGYTRKWMTVTISDNTAIQILRFYTPIVGADDLAAACWQLELGSTVTSYYPALATFTSRASVGTYIDINGKVASALTNVARMQYQYPSLAAVAPRLLVEPAATNYATFSQDFTQSVWGKGNAGNASVPVVTANVGLAPDGTMTADRLVCTRTGNVSSDYSLITRTITGPASGNYVHGYWMKSNTGLTQNVLLYGSSKGVVCSVTNEWQRFSLPDISGSTSWVTLFGTRGGSGFVYTGGDPSIDILVWQGQVEQGSAPTSDIVTPSSATVTRAADVVSYSAGVRPVGYMDWWQSYAYDSGAVLCCPAPARIPRGWTAATAASAYAYGGGASARVWMPSATSATTMMIDIVDTANAQGYIEASHVVAGAYWSPAKNPTYGASMTPIDRAKQDVTDAGDLWVDAATKSRKMDLPLENISATDRGTIVDMFMAAGCAYSMLVSLYPEDSDAKLERDHTIYGKLTALAALNLPFFSSFTTSLPIQEI